MQRILPNDLVAVEVDGAFYLFAILTKQILFGGHWVFVFHGARNVLPSAEEKITGSGYNAAVDFIGPKREGRVFRVSRGNDFSHLLGPELLQQEPFQGEPCYQIWRWLDGLRKEAEWIRSTRTPTPEERSAPHYCCIQAARACELARENWQERMTMYDDVE